MWLGHGTETSVRRLGASWAQRTSTTILTTTQRRFVLGIEAWQGWFPTYRSRQCMFQEKAEKRKIKTTLNKSRTTTPLQISVSRIARLGVWPLEAVQEGRRWKGLTCRYACMHQCQSLGKTMHIRASEPVFVAVTKLARQTYRHRER